MNRPRAALALFALLAACKPAAVEEAEAAEARLQLLEQSRARPQELCAGKREVAQAWLNALDREKYEMADIEADLACNKVEIDRLLAQ